MMRAMMIYLKHSWFFIITAIFVFISLFNNEYLKVISMIAVYFFIEVSILLIAFKYSDSEINGESELDDK